MDPDLGRVFRGDRSVHVETRPMEVLVLLAEHGTGLVTRRQLIAEVWGSDDVADNTLTRAIAHLRAALNDDAKTPSYIETIHRRGYRLVQSPRPLETGRGRVWTGRDRGWIETSDRTGRR